MAADGLVLHLHVGVEGDEGAVGEAGQGIDLGEGHVVVALQLGEAGEDGGGPGELAAGEAAGGGDHLLGAEVGDGVEVGEVPAADVVGVLLGDLLDVDAAHVGEEHHRALGAAVPEDRGVVLLLDLGLRVDQDADRHVAVDLELEDLRRRATPPRSGVSANLTPPAFIRPPVSTWDLITVGPADPLRGLAGLRGGLAEAVLGDRDPGPLDDAAALELVEAHGRRRRVPAR